MCTYIQVFVYVRVCVCARVFIMTVCVVYTYVLKRIKYNYFKTYFMYISKDNL